MGAAHREHARLRGARRESLRVIQVACAEAQCAQRRGRTAPRTSPRSPALKMAMYFFCLSVQTGGGY
eukprot:scaffold6262_cov53-Phaeocystis_antarctica.AAC.2